MYIMRPIQKKAHYRLACNFRRHKSLLILLLDLYIIVILINSYVEGSCVLACNTIKHNGTLDENKRLELSCKVRVLLRECSPKSEINCLLLSGHRYWCMPTLHALSRCICDHDVSSLL